MNNPLTLTIPCLDYDVYFTYKEMEAYRDWVTQSCRYYVMKPDSINTQSLKKCHTLYCNYTSPYSESAWKQLFDEDIYTCQWKYLISGMRLNCSFCALKYPLNRMFYDSNETIALPENKIHTWLRSRQSLESTTPQDWATHAFSQETCQYLIAQMEVVTSKVCPECIRGMCHSW